MEQSFQKYGPGQKCSPQRGALTEYEAKMGRVIAALWRAFPEAVSENDLATRAAPYFRKRCGAAIDPRTVRLWLNGTSMPSSEYILVLIGMVGAEFFGLPAKGRV